MTDESQRPDLESFLQAPVDVVRKVAPITVIYAPGGTRRQAVLEGVSLNSEAYVQWSRPHIFACIEVFFRLGVKNLFKTALQSPQFHEVGYYREHVLDWVKWGLAGTDSLADYARLGWRVRIIGAEQVPELQPAAQKLIDATPEHWEHTLWWYLSADPGAHWETLLACAHRTQAITQMDLIRGLCGEDVPPASMMVSYGKMIFSPDIIPVIMAGDMQCYWPQKPGYSLDEETLRRIIYDNAYLRRTWKQDKSTRYQSAIEHRALWEKQFVVGLGKRVGAFWYPQMSEERED